VLDRVKAGAFGEHPAGEDTLHLAGELHLIDLDEGRGMRRLGGGARIADPGRHLERAELDRLVDRDLEMRDAPCHLVEGGEHGDRVLDDVRVSEVHREPRGEGCYQQGNRAGYAASGNSHSWHHAAHLLNGPLDNRSGALLALSMISPEAGFPLSWIML
jgi:hypothetical protein